MAISLQKCMGRANTSYSEFFCDYISEIDLLPTTTRGGAGIYKLYAATTLGSSCYCFEDNNIYLLSSNGWKIV